VTKSKPEKAGPQFGKVTVQEKMTVQEALKEWERRFL
jgi:hypothetical protein